MHLVNLENYKEKILLTPRNRIRCLRIGRVKNHILILQENNLLLVLKADGVRVYETKCHDAMCDFTDDGILYVLVGRKITRICIDSLKQINLDLTKEVLSWKVVDNFILVLTDTLEIYLCSNLSLFMRIEEVGDLLDFVMRDRGITLLYSTGLMRYLDFDHKITFECYVDTARGVSVIFTHMADLVILYRKGSRHVCVISLDVEGNPFTYSKFALSSDVIACSYKVICNTIEGPLFSGNAKLVLVVVHSNGIASYEYSIQEFRSEPVVKRPVDPSNMNEYILEKIEELRGELKPELSN